MPAERDEKVAYRKLVAILFAILCFELGLFLVIFPWMERWEHNYFAWITPLSPEGVDWARRWRSLWLSPYFRGLVSGIGLINLYIAVLEVIALRRFAAPPEAVDQTPVSIE